MFDFLKTSDDEKNKPAEEGVVAEKSVEPAVPPPSSTGNNENKGIFDTLKEKIGLGGDEKTEENAVATTPPAPEPAMDTPPAVPESSADNTESLTDKITGFFTTKGDEAEKSDSTDSEETQEDGEVSDVSDDVSDVSEDASEDASEDGGEDGGDFDIVLQKMKNLQNKYGELKTKHSNLKLEMEKKLTEKTNKDNGELATVLSAIEAAELAITEAKKHIITYSKHNGLPTDKLGYSETEDSSSMPEPVMPKPMDMTPPPPPAPAPAPAPAPVMPEPVMPEPVMPEPVMPAPTDAAMPAPAPAPAPASMDMTPPPPAPMMSAPAPLDDGSNSNSGSDSSDAEEGNPTSTLPEIPVNETTPDSLPQQQPTATSFNGGRNHYVQSMNKKAKTHRHHKRRNRHQTLRSSAK